MYVGNRLVGLALTAVGVTGMAVCVAASVGTWLGLSRLRQVNSAAFHQVSQLVTQVDRRAEEARDALGETRDLIEELKQTLSDSAPDLVAQRLTSLPAIDTLERRLASAMERAEGLVQLSASTAELIDQLLVGIEEFASERNLDLRGSTERRASFESTRESLADASEHLSDVRHRLAEVRQKRDVPGNLPQIMTLSVGIVAKLDGVHEQIAAFRGRLEQTQIRLVQLQHRLSARILNAQWLIQLLIAWAGAGQYCLLVHGWRILRPSSVGQIAES